MDCCNYRPYKNHYYGAVPQYFNQLHPYHGGGGGNYYNVPPYATDYYGNTPYYTHPHPWHCGGTPFPDYVYNPKEARMRKALRDANRERCLGLAASRNTRRSQPWILPQPDEQFLMNQHGMRGIASPVCNNGYPIAASNQFMGPIQAYNKQIHLSPHEASYQQVSYAQLQNVMPQMQQQQQTEMWHYHECSTPLRPPTGDGYLLSASPMSPFHPQQQPAHSLQGHGQGQAMDSNAQMDKLKTSMEEEFIPDESNSNDTTVSSRMSLSEHSFGSAGSSETHHEGSLVDMYQHELILQSACERAENVKNRKKASLTPLSQRTQKPLPDFNEAFGATERGRFQSPPDPRLPPKQGYLDNFFLINNELKFDDFNL